MKNKKLRKMISVWSASAALAMSFTLASAHAGREGSGGAGLERDGRYMTFYSAGLYTEPAPAQDQDEIPGLDGLIGFIEKFSFISDEMRLNFINTVLPSRMHEYYKVKEDRFDEATLQRLLAEFNRVTGQPTERLKLFAITDTNSGKTFLLPGFYRLNPEEQMAILFHENYWMMNPKSNYSTVVAAEMAFQAVLAQPKKMNRVLDLLGYFGGPGSRLVAVIKSDLTSGALAGLERDQMIPIKSLLGDEFFNCLEKSDYKGRACLDAIKLNLYRLSQKYPQSMLIRQLYSRKERLGYYYYNNGKSREERGLFCTRYGYCDGGSKVIWQKVYVGESIFGNSKYQSIDYSKCYLNLNIDRGFSQGVSYIPVVCEGLEDELYDSWLSSEE